MVNDFFPSSTRKVKIINPQRRSEVIVRQLHHFKSQFDSVVAIRVKLAEEFKEQVPNTLDFSVGYFEGQQHTKVWLISKDDLEAMYTRYPRGEITLWCHGRDVGVQESGQGKRKKETESTSTSVSKRQEKEEEVDGVYKELKEKHGDAFDTPKLRLWARMVCSNLHEDLDHPPNVPAFNGSNPKKPRRQESLSDALCNAAVTFASTFSSTSGPPKTPDGPPAGISPYKSVELRMKNFQQLRFLQQLYDGILTLTEYTEQKQNILSSLRKLS